MPALRDRKEDIVPLARRLLARSLADPSRTPQLTDDAALALREYAWPGNIRELRNVLERAALLCNDNTITRRDLRFESTSAQDAHAGDLNLTLQQIERQHIKRVLHDVGGKVEQASLRLGVPRSTLYQKIKLHGIAAAPGDPD